MTERPSLRKKPTKRNRKQKNIENQGKPGKKPKTKKNKIFSNYGYPQLAVKDPPGPEKGAGGKSWGRPDGEALTASCGLT